MLLNWDGTDSVGVPELDRDHQYIFDIANHLRSAMHCGLGWTAVGGILSELEVYVEKHFLAEEAFMRTRAFPGLAAHQLEHNGLRGELHELRKRYLEGQTQLAVELMDFLLEAIRNHLEGTDRQYAPAPQVVTSGCPA